MATLDTINATPEPTELDNTKMPEGLSPEEQHKFIQKLAAQKATEKTGAVAAK